MATKNIGAKIVLEGADEYKQNIKSINASQKELQSELKLCSAQFEGQENSLEALEKKQEIYTKQLENQNARLEEYQKMLESASREHEKAEQNVEALSKKLEEAEQAYKEMADSGNATTEELDAQAESIKAISKELNQANGYYEKTGEAVKEWQTKVNNASADVETLNKRIETNTGYIEEAKTATDKCATSIDEYGKKTKTAADENKSFWEGAGAVAAGNVLADAFENLIGLIEKAGSKMIALGANTAYLADEINTLSTKTGVSTDTIQELRYAEELMDTSVESITGSMRRNIKSMEKAKEGSEKYADAYKKLGIEIQNADGSLRDSEIVYWEMIDALGRMKNAAERDATAMQLFGRSAQELNPLIKMGSEGFQKLADEAHAVGYVMDTETLNGLNDTSDALERASKYADSLKNKIGAQMAPTIEKAVAKITKKLEENEDQIMEIAEKAIEALSDAISWILDHTEEIEAFGKVVLVAAGAFAGFTIVNKVKDMMANLSPAIDTAKAKIAELSTASGLSVGALAGIAAGIVAVTAAVTALCSWVEKQPAAQLANEFKNLNKEIEENQKQFDSDIKSIQTQESLAKGLTAQIDELQKKETLTTEEKRKMAQMVSQLNKVYPDLNAQIDKETGKLKGNTDAIYKNVEAQKKQLEYEKKKEQINKLIEEQIELENQLAEAYQNVDNYARGFGTTTEELVQNDGLWFGDWYGKNLIDQSEAINAALESNKQKLEELTGKTADYEAAEESANEQAQILTTTLIDLGGKTYAVTGITDETRAKILELAEAYNKAKEDAYNSLKSQVGMFEELKTEAEKSVEETTDIMRKNAQIMNQYKTDMALLAKAADQGLIESGLYEDLKAMGTDGAGFVREVAEAMKETNGTVGFASEESAKAIRDWNSAYSDLDGALQSTAEVLTVDYKNAAEEALGITEDNFEAMEETATKAVETIQATIEDAEFAGAMESAMTEAVKAAEDALGIDASGRAEVFVKIGEAIPESMCDGIEHGRQSLIDKMDSVIDSMIGRIKARQSDISKAVDQALGDATD